MPVIQECGPAQQVFIAVPAYDFRVDIDVMNSIFQTVGMLSGMGIDVTVAALGGNCYLDQVRNSLTQDFLESGFSDMLFWDADVIAPPVTVARLVTSRHPLCAALYPKKQDDEAWPVFFEIKEMGLSVPSDQTQDHEGYLEALYIPTGMMRINKQVFSDYASHRPAYPYREVKGREVQQFFKLDISPEHKLWWGEDVLFCRHWREIGGRCWFLPDATLGHIGRKVWRGNWLASANARGHVRPRAAE